MAVFPERRFSVVAFGGVKSHFVTIDASDIHNVMLEISSELDVSGEAFIGGNL